MNVDYCVCCGNYVPEGRQVCYECDGTTTKQKQIWDELNRTLAKFISQDKRELRSFNDMALYISLNK